MVVEDKNPGEGASSGQEHRCGFIAIFGKPNAGKSTLLNRLVGEKIAIVSPKPQTTRERIQGVVTRPGAQFLFVDMPGFIAPRDMLNKALADTVEINVDRVDLVLHLVDAQDLFPLEPPLGPLLEKIKCPVVCAVNKVDRYRTGFSLERRLLERPTWISLSRYAAPPVLVSAKSGAGTKELLDLIEPLLPRGVAMYDEDDVTDRDMRWLCAEYVREQVFGVLGDELPYAVATQTEDFVEKPDGKWLVRVVVYVERDSQKSIVIGEGGKVLKEIGQRARLGIEEITGHPVFLELWVKTKKNWRKNEIELKRLGYVTEKDKTRRRNR